MKWGIVVSVSRADGGKPQLLSFESPEVRIGANAECDVVLSDSAVSGDHAHVTLSGGKLTLYDHSRNGTFVSGERVERRALQDGDVVAIRPFELKFSLVQAGKRRTQKWEMSGTSFLEVVKGPKGLAGKRYELGPKGFRIGRSSEADLSFELETLSRLHAEVKPRARGVWVLRDLESANGTFVDGHRVTELRLLPGTEVTFGSDLVLRFVQEQPPDPARAATLS